MPLANQVGTVTARLTGILRHGVMAGSPGETCFFDFFLVSYHLILTCLSIPVQITILPHVEQADFGRCMWI